MTYTVRTNSLAEQAIIVEALGATQRLYDAGAINGREKQKNAIRQMLLAQERSAWLFAAKRVLQASLEVAEDGSSIFHEIQTRIQYLEENGAQAHPSQIACTVGVEI